MAARDMTAAQGLAYPVPASRRSVEIGAVARRIARRGAAVGLIVLMAGGALALWTVIPIGGLWVAAQLSETYTQSSAATLLVAVLGIPMGVALGGKGLARLELLYLRVTGGEVSSYVPGWRRSLSDSASGPPPGVLDRILVASVVAATVSFVGWFVLFAGRSVPV